MKGAVIYVRVSTAEQASSNQSLPVQESKARALCQQRGLGVLKLFTDRGESARTDDRPQFQKMLEYCRQHRREISHVVVADLSRLARNVLDQGQTIVELTEMGITLLSVDEPNLDDSAAGRLLKNVLGSMNQFFSDSLSEKTKFRMAAGVKQGRWLWVAPLGYRNDTSTKSIAIDSERAPLVAKAFELIAEGAAIGDVLRRVTALGLRTRTGRQVSKQTFGRMFRNPFYAGWIVSGGTRSKGSHDPLVTENIFEAVQQQLGGGTPHQIERDDFPLRGFIRCAKCGKNLTAGWAKGRSKVYSRYWCFTKGCNGTSVSAEELEKRLHWLLIGIQPEAHLLAKLPILAARSWDARKERISLDAKTLRRRLEDQRTLNQQTIEARVRGTLNDDDFKTMKASIDAEMARVQEQMEALDSEVCTVKALMAQTQREVINFGESWKQAPAHRKREIQKALFPEGLVYDQKTFFLNQSNRSLLIDLTTENDPQFIEENVLSIIGVPDGI